MIYNSHHTMKEPKKKKKKIKDKDVETWPGRKEK